MSKTLLLADDSLTIQRVVDLTFAEEDVRVVSFPNGEQAVKWMEDERPDIVLADVGMPQPDGYALSTHMKQSARLRNVPVLLLTGAFEPIDDEKARESACDGILVKPFEPQHLVSRVAELLARPANATPANAPAATDAAASVSPPAASPSAAPATPAAVPDWDQEQQQQPGPSASRPELRLVEPPKPVVDSPGDAGPDAEDLAALDESLEMIDLPEFTPFAGDAAPAAAESTSGVEAIEIDWSAPLTIGRAGSGAMSADALSDGLERLEPLTAAAWDLAPSVVSTHDSAARLDLNPSHDVGPLHEPLHDLSLLHDAAPPSASGTYASADPAARAESSSHAQAPSGPETASPAAASLASGPVSLASAFTALLAAEHTHFAATPAAAMPEAMIEDVVRRVLMRVTDEVVRQIVLDSAERLIKEEIDKIKSEPDSD